MSRYLNDAAWAGRTLPHRARAEPWAALVLDGLDGYACWTGCVWPRNKYRTGYGTNPRYTYLDLPPERQWGTQLVYYRKVDGVFRPLSCRRLEDIRDGLIDVLYHRLAAERLRVAGDEAGLARLKEIAVRPKTRYADYESARAEMAALAAAAVEQERQTVKRR